MLGVVLRYVDINNYYFATLSRSSGSLALGKVVAGVTSTLVTWGFPGGSSYKSGQAFQLTLLVNSTSMMATVRSAVYMQHQSHCADPTAAGGGATLLVLCAVRGWWR